MTTTPATLQEALQRLGEAEVVVHELTLTLSALKDQRHAAISANASTTALDEQMAQTDNELRFARATAVQAGEAVTAAQNRVQRLRGRLAQKINAAREDERQRDQAQTIADQWARSAAATREEAAVVHGELLSAFGLGEAEGLDAALAAFDAGSRGTQPALQWQVTPGPVPAYPLPTRTLYGGGPGGRTLYFDKEGKPTNSMGEPLGEQGAGSDAQ